MVVESRLVALTLTSDFASALTKEFGDIEATIESGFTLKRVRDITKIHCQSGVGFESSCSDLNFRFRTCFEQQVS